MLFNLNKLCVNLLVVPVFFCDMAKNLLLPASVVFSLMSLGCVIEFSAIAGETFLHVTISSPSK